MNKNKERHQNRQQNMRNYRLVSW